MKTRIFFKSKEQITKYINNVDRFKGDIDILVGSKVYDGKSLLTMTNLPLTILRVEYNGEDVVEFEKFISQFRLKGE